MTHADYLEATRNNFHLEEWEALLDDFLRPHKDIDFLFNGYCIMIIVEHHPENVPVFNHRYHLSDIVLASTIQDFFEERCIVVEIICHHELILEASPNIVIFKLLCRRS